MKYLGVYDNDEGSEDDRLWRGRGDEQSREGEKENETERKIRAKRPAAANERVRTGRRRAANDDGNQTLTPVYACYSYDFYRPGGHTRMITDEP